MAGFGIQWDRGSFRGENQRPLVTFRCIYDFPQRRESLRPVAAEKSNRWLWRNLDPRHLAAARCNNLSSQRLQPDLLDVFIGSRS